VIARLWGRGKQAPSRCSPWRAIDGSIVHDGMGCGSGRCHAKWARLRDRGVIQPLRRVVSNEWCRAHTADLSPPDGRHEQRSVLITAMFACDLGLALDGMDGYVSKRFSRS